MPIIASAKKKMRQDKKREIRNSGIKVNLKSLLKNARRAPLAKAFQELQSALDKAVKTKLIHANQASRLKSRLSKVTEPAKQATKKATKKKVVKKVSKKK